MEEDAFTQSIICALDRNVARTRALARASLEGVSFGRELDRAAEDLADPRSAGWTFLVNRDDPSRARIEEILEPLARHRGMSDPKKPLLYATQPADEWLNWLNDNYYSLELDHQRVPRYILVVGDPSQVPFLFQSLLGTVANVGRVDFDDLGDLGTYIDKLIRVETASEPLVSAKTLLFAPDHGLPDPTYFSREYMVAPLREYIEVELRAKTRAITGPDATKKILMQGFAANPALVYSASHGLGAIDRPVDFQKRYNGAVCCQHEGALSFDALFTADDVPKDRPFLEGAVFFQFACFGYGTPAQSDFAHWLDGVPKDYAPAGFVAALPKALLAHPRGPIAFVGHLDTAFLHGFANAEEPHILERWHTRVAPFVSAVRRLLEVQPCALAMEFMSKRYSISNTLITNTYDRVERGALQWSAELKTRFLDNWIVRGDSQNYLILGDPAARLRIPSP